MAIQSYFSRCRGCGDPRNEFRKLWNDGLTRPQGFEIDVAGDVVIPIESRGIGGRWLVAEDFE